MPAFLSYPFSPSKVLLRTSIQFTQRMVENVFGYDYGIKPKVMVVADTEFPEILRNSFVAVGYNQVPQFGDRVNVPLLMMLFKDLESGDKCFTHFNAWCNASGDGESVGVGFVEFEDGGYGMCIYPEHEQLIERCISEVLRPEVEPLVISIGHLKAFEERSIGYQWFKSLIRAGIAEFILAPGTPEYGLMLDLAIIKRKVHFYSEKDVPEDTMEKLLITSRELQGKAKLKMHSPSELVPTAKEIRERRCFQLRRFFPVTIERLRLNQEFLGIKKRLIEEGYKEWQIIQAACNICLIHRSPKVFASDDGSSESRQKDSIPIRILDYLLINIEGLDLSLPPLEKLSFEIMRRQIYADSIELIRYFTTTEVDEKDNKEIQNDIMTLGLL